MITVNFDILNEVSYDVERYNKSVSKKDGLEYKVPVSDFLDGLLYNQQSFKATGEYDEYGEPLGDYEFITLLTNPRLSKKAMSVYFAVKDRIDYSDFISNVYTKIYDTITADNLSYININYDNYSAEKDYISKLVFLIDKEVRGEALEESGLKYNKDWNENNLPMYENKLGIEVRLDAYSVEQETKNENFISTDEVIGCTYRTAEDVEREEQKIAELMNYAKLTNKQKKYLKMLMINDYNQTEVARQMGLHETSSWKMMSRIRDKFNSAFNNKYKDDDIIEDFDNMLDEEKINTMDVANFLKENIDKDARLEELFYNSSTINKRGYMVLFIQGLDVHEKGIEPFIKDFLYNFYTRHKNV